MAKLQGHFERNAPIKAELAKKAAAAADNSP
jgi:hypothetical protein